MEAEGAESLRMEAEKLRAVESPSPAEPVGPSVVLLSVQYTRAGVEEVGRRTCGPLYYLLFPLTATPPSYPRIPPKPNSASAE